MMDQVFVDRKNAGLPTHRLRFLPSGTVHSDWFEWGSEEPREVKTNAGRYTQDGASIRVTWPPRSPSVLQRLIGLFFRQTGVVVEYRLTERAGRTYLVRESSFDQYSRWSAEPEPDSDRLPPGTYQTL